MQISHTKDTLSQIYLDALAIRNVVFIKEQQVPLEREVDAYEAETIHFVLYMDEGKRPAATVRLLPVDDKKIKVQRMAVLSDFRSMGLGSKVMDAAEEFAKEQGYETIMLGAQLTAKPFYEHLGYSAKGEVFLDAGIKHIEMSKQL
ncbi:MAG TPA: GNAT family N-acetyltransferase [Candidatus Tetragenococcus pullicola]|nr:GNAT family N-acetyltransferase [Candidatus Tetragenococcus pullicola]